MGARLVALRLPQGEALAGALRDAWERNEAVLPVPPSWPDGAVGRLLSSARPHGIRTVEGEDDLPDPSPVADEVALVLTSSGSTGEPKLVELDRAALEHAVDASLARLRASRSERWLACLPLEHVGGILVLLRSWRLGVEPVVHGRFDPASVLRTDVTRVSLVPTMLARLLDTGTDLTGLHVLLGGAAAGTALVARAREAGAAVTVTYGMTETCGGCVYDGVALDGVEVQVAVDGRIEIAGPVLMRGYRGRPDLTAEVLRDGWLQSGDLGAWSDDGRLEVLGRADDVIVTGGENVVPGEVEAVLRRHPAIADVAVVGWPDREWGERVGAVCVLAPDASRPSLEELRAHVRAHAPPHHAPKEVRYVNALPRTEHGKVDRQALRAVRGLPRDGG